MIPAFSFGMSFVPNRFHTSGGTAPTIRICCFPPVVGVAAGAKLTQVWSEGFVETPLTGHHLPEGILEGLPVSLKDGFVIFACQAGALENVVAYQIYSLKRLTKAVE